MMAAVSAEKFIPFGDIIMGTACQLRIEREPNQTKREYRCDDIVVRSVSPS